MTSPAPSADQRCPRCGNGFHCGAGDPEPCACTALVLAPELLARLRREYQQRCLCLTCLRELSQAPTR